MEASERNRLIVECQGLVRSIAWKIHRKLPRTIDLDDLISYGNLGLTYAARDFDPARGYSFTTYAYHRIRGSILDGLKQMNWFRLVDYHRGHYERLADDLVTGGSDEEQLAGGDERPTTVGWLHDMSERLTVSRLLFQSCEVIERVADQQEEAPDACMVREETACQLRELVDQLPQVEGDLIKATYYQGITLKEAGERLGRSKSWASRLHAKAIGRLARAMRGAARR